MTVQNPEVRKAVLRPRSGIAVETGPVGAARTPVWVDLVAAGLKEEKIDQQPVALWRQ